MADLQDDSISNELLNEQNDEEANQASTDIGEIVDALQEMFTGKNPEEEGLGDPR